MSTTNKQTITRKQLRENYIEAFFEFCELLAKHKYKSNYEESDSYEFELKFTNEDGFLVSDIVPEEKELGYGYDDEGNAFYKGGKPVGNEDEEISLDYSPDYYFLEHNFQDEIRAQEDENERLREADLNRDAGLDF